jgi:phage terminase small subunit
MTRKKRADSTDEQVRAMQAGQIHPPSHVPLTDADMPFFANVIDEFARSEWTAHQLELAAMLSRIMCDLNEAQQALRDQGPTAKSDRGTPVVNPLVSIVKGYTGDILSMRRSLALHARARNGGDNRNTATRNSKLKGSQDAAGDDLLARPN